MLLERDFGTLSENNKTLIKKHFGYDEYDSMFHSAGGAPPEGESFYQLYNRIAAYYHEVLRPLAEVGKTVLVDAHKYPIEMFALLAAGMPPDDYRDFKIPNSKPNSFEDLGRHARNVVAEVDWLGEMVEIHLPAMLAAALAFGIMLKLTILSCFQMNADVAHGETNVFYAVLFVFTGINSFFVFLRTPPDKVRDVGKTAGKFWVGLALRVAIALALIFGVRQPVAEAAGLFLLVPPTMAVPTLSLMWGGDYFLSVRLSLALSLVAPFVLLGVYLLATWVHLPMMMDLVPFLLLFLFGVIVPAGTSQVLRRVHAVKAGAISTNWSWLGGAALLPLGFAAGFYFVTPQLLHQVAAPSGVATMETDFAIAIGLLLATRLCGILANRFTTVTEPQAIDSYVCSIAPNIFFWCSVTSKSNSLFTLALLIPYFLSLWLEDKRFVQRYAQTVSTGSQQVLTPSKRIAFALLPQFLWQKASKARDFKHPL